VAQSVRAYRGARAIGDGQHISLSRLAASLRLSVFALVRALGVLLIHGVGLVVAGAMFNDYL
jgi:hypothetical protein